MAVDGVARRPSLLGTSKGRTSLRDRHEIGDESFPTTASIHWRLEGGMAQRLSGASILRGWKVPSLQAFSDADPESMK